MKFKKIIGLLVLVIVPLSILASIAGIMCSSQSGSSYEFISLHGQSVTIYGKGLYQYESNSMAAQAIAQDYVTLFLGVPLLIGSFYLTVKGSLKGKLLLLGTLGYFLYTYASYSFLAMYNEFFLIYLLLFVCSFYAFILMMISIDMNDLKTQFSNQLPVKFIGGVSIFISVMLLMMWLGRIVPPLMEGTTPESLEHYSTLVIQVLDLVFIVPLGIISGILLIKRHALGYLLSSVIFIKGLTLGTAVTAMVISLIQAGETVSYVEIVVFPIFNLVVIYCLYLMLSDLNKKRSV